MHRSATVKQPADTIRIDLGNPMAQGILYESGGQNLLFSENANFANFIVVRDRSALINIKNNAICEKTAKRMKF
jgi:hypothetical protein